MLSREEIKRAFHGPVLTVNVPAWGGDVCIKRMAASDLIELREAFRDEPEGDSENANASRNMDYVCMFLSMVLCDESGTRIFTQDELREWDNQQSDALNQLIEAAKKHNGLDKQSSEDREKNSESGQTSGST